MNQQCQIVFPARECAELQCVPHDPDPLGPNEVAGTTICTLVSVGTEIEGAFIGKKFPKYPGYAAVFRVDEVGENVSNIRPGQLAFCMGPHRSYQRMREDHVVLLPEGMDPFNALCARIMVVSMSTLTTTTTRPPARVLVCGLGLIGHLAVQIFSESGYETYGYDPLPERRQLLLDAGYNALPEHPLHNPALCGTIGLVLECSGNEQSVLDSCRAVRKRGEVVLVGVPWRARTDLPAWDLLHAVFHHFVVLRSGWEWELPLHDTEFRRNSIFGNLHAALRWINDGVVSVDALYKKARPADCQAVFTALKNQEWPALTAAFDWTTV